MKSDKRIKTYNKRFKNELDKALKLIEPYLIKAFAMFYGEEYSEQIKRTIQNIKYTYFLSESYFELVEKRSFGISARDQRIIRYYIKYLHGLDIKFQGVRDISFLEEMLYDTLIVKSFFDKETLLYCNFLEFLKDDVPVYSVIADINENNFKVIFLPIFIINLEIIIHEINHALMIDVIATTEDEFIMPNLFITEACEEIFNDYIAHLVLQNYFKLKAPFPQSLRRFDFKNKYEDYFYLIEVFYYVFEKVIKASIITKNFNLLWRYAGEEDFKLFCKLVEDYYLKKDCTEEEMEQLNELVLKMNNHAFSISGVNYESYFKELKSMGYKVRRLKR